jgi:hypothetical protein
MEMGVGHADFAHASPALCLCAFVTLCHMKLPRKEHAKAVNTNGSFRRVNTGRLKHDDNNNGIARDRFFGV